MKRLLVAVAVAAVAFFAVGAIGDATQTRPDERHHDLKTEVVVHIEGKNYRQNIDTAAYALWASCSATVAGDLVEPGIEPLGDGDYRFAMTPSLGHHGKERLLGCLRDLTVDRLKSNVESVQDVALSS